MAQFHLWHLRLFAAALAGTAFIGQPIPAQEPSHAETGVTREAIWPHNADPAIANSEIAN